MTWSEEKAMQARVEIARLREADAYDEAADLLGDALAEIDRRQKRDREVAKSLGDAAFEPTGEHTHHLLNLAAQLLDEPPWPAMTAFADPVVLEKIAGARVAKVALPGHPPEPRPGPDEK